MPSSAGEGEGRGTAFHLHTHSHSLPHFVMVCARVSLTLHLLTPEASYKYPPNPPMLTSTSPIPPPILMPTHVDVHHSPTPTHVDAHPHPTPPAHADVSQQCISQTIMDINTFIALCNTYKLIQCWSTQCVLC